MSKKVYVGNLSFQTTESDVRSAFEQFGTVESVTIITDRDTRERSPGPGRELTKSYLPSLPSCLSLHLRSSIAIVLDNWAGRKRRSRHLSAAPGIGWNFPRTLGGSCDTFDHRRPTSRATTGYDRSTTLNH